MATVIKLGAQLARPAKPRTFELKDHVAQATALVEAGRHRADRIVQDVRRQSEAIRQKAAREGYRSGHHKGFGEGKKAGHAQAFAEATVLFRMDNEQLSQSLQAAIDDLESRKRDLIIHARQDALKLAIQIAERITRRLGTTDPNVVLGNVESALRLVGQKTNLTIRVNPKDVTSIRRFSPDWGETELDGQHVRIVEDESVSRGGCLVTTPDQEIDSRLETQLEEITALLIGPPDAPTDSPPRGIGMTVTPPPPTASSSIGSESTTEANNP